jgi:glutamyl-tRNA reductase
MWNITWAYYSDAGDKTSMDSVELGSMRYNSPNTRHRLAPAGASQFRELSSIKAPSTLFAFGINHKTAPVEVREKLFLNDDEARQFLCLVRSTLPECLVLSTCNRTEIYGVTESPKFEIAYFKNLLVDFKAARSYVQDEHFFELISCSASQQLFSVATSVDSKVVGDLQILKQLRSAYSLARETGSAGKILNQLLQRAFKIGKQTFTESSIHEGAVSASLAAVETALEIFGSLRDRTALVLGAGDTARLTAEALINKRVRKLIVSNRTRSHAAELLGSLELGATETDIIDFGGFHHSLRNVDIVISSTGSTVPIIRPDDIKRLTRKLLLIDIAVPRDIEPAVANHPLVTLKNIDDLDGVVHENHERRLRDLPKVKKLIGREMVEFLTWYYTLPLLPACGKTGEQPTAKQKSEILRVKQFLNDNLNEIHSLYASAKGDFQQDLDNHFALVKRLQSMKVEALRYATT